MEKHEHAGKGAGSFVDVDKVISLILDKGGAFLDVGCGPGDYLESAARLTKDITGIDSDPKSIETVKSRGFRGILADVTKGIPLKDGSVDSVLLSNVLHGFVLEKTEGEALPEIRRVLKSRGRLGIVEFKKDSAIGPPYGVKLSESQLASVLADYGFREASRHDVGRFSYLIIFMKS